MSEEWTTIARDAWAAAGVADRIDLRIGPARHPRALPDDPVVDLAYIDANKEGYIDYFEAIVPRLRPAGSSSSTTPSGAAGWPTPSADDETPLAIRAFNDHVVADPRVDAVMRLHRRRPDRLRQNARVSRARGRCRRRAAGLRRPAARR